MYVKVPWVLGLTALLHQEILPLVSVFYVLVVS